MIAARRQLHPLGGLCQQFAAGRVGCGDRLEQLAIGFGVCPYVAVRVCAVARCLDGACRGDAGGDGRAASAGGGKVRSAADSAGTSICRSIRSNKGPEIFAW